MPLCAASCEEFAFHQAQIGGFETIPNRPCAEFYGSVCPFFQDEFEELSRLAEAVAAGPVAPPPPMSPFRETSMFELAPTRVYDNVDHFWKKLDFAESVCVLGAEFASDFPFDTPFELWASDSLAFFGSRILSALAGVAAETRIPVPGPTCARYWSLRLYDHAREKLNATTFADAQVGLFGYLASTGTGQPSPPPPPPLMPPPLPPAAGRRIAEELAAAVEVASNTPLPGLLKMAGRRLDQTPELEAIYRDFLPEFTPKPQYGGQLREALLANLNLTATAQTWALPQKTALESLPRGMANDLYLESELVNATNTSKLEYETTTDGFRRPVNARGHPIAASAVVAFFEAQTIVPCLVEAEEMLLELWCAKLLCNVSFHAHPLLDEPVNAFYLENTTLRDDHLMAAWAIAQTAGAAIRAVNASLPCLVGLNRPRVCATVMANASAVHTTTTALELTLARTDQPSCVADVGCLVEVGKQTARELATIFVSKDEVLAKIAMANAQLLDGLVGVIAANETFFNTSELRNDLAVAHREAVAAALGNHTTEPPRHPSKREANYTANEKRLFLTTQAFHHVVADTPADLDRLHHAHHQVIRAWAQSGAVAATSCVDPYASDDTTMACKKWFSVAGALLRNARAKAKATAARGEARKRRQLHAESEAELTAAVEQQLGNTCCAKFEFDGREECHEKHCETHVIQQNLKRMAKILRGLDDDHKDEKLTGKRKPHHKHRVSGHELMGPALNTVVDNFVLPELHPDPRCQIVNRSSISAGGPTRAECFANSYVAHAAHHHGLDGQTILGHMEKAGLSAGVGMQKVQKTMGLFKEIRHSGNTKKRTKQQSKRQSDAKKAQQILRGAGRRLDESEQPKPKSKGFGHAAAQIAEDRRQRKNSTSIMSEHFKRSEAIIQSQRLERATTGRGGLGAFDHTPKAGGFDWQHLRKSIVSPSLAYEIVSADEGSLASRFRGAARKLNSVATRWYTAKAAAEQSLAEKEAGRKLSTRLPKSAIFDSLTKGRRLQEGSQRNIPSDHHLSWLHDIVDWQSAHKEWTRLVSVLEGREKARVEGVSRRRILEQHPTGYTWLDDHERHEFTPVGDALRRLWHRKTSGEDVVHEREAPRGFVRRLSSGFFGPVVAAPFSFGDTVMFDGTPKSYTIRGTPFSEWLTAPLRYIVYSTVSCYLQKPSVSGIATQANTGAPNEGTDGAKLGVLRPKDETKLCFPGIPFLVPTMLPWRVLTKTEGVDYRVRPIQTPCRLLLLCSVPVRILVGQKDITYEEFCTRNGAQEHTRDAIQVLGFEITSDTASWLGVGGILRVAEAVDSITSFVLAGQSSGKESLGLTFCGLAELGGVVFTVAVLLALLLLLPLVAGAAFVFGFVFDLLIVACAGAQAANKSRLRRRRLESLEKKKKREAANEQKKAKQKKLGEELEYIKKQEANKKEAAKKPPTKPPTKTPTKAKATKKTNASLGFLSGLRNRVNYSEVRTGEDAV